MSDTILLTAAKEDSEKILGELADRDVLHTPLEVYVSLNDDATILDTLNNLGEFENLVHSSVRNARFFLEQVKQHDKLEAVRNCLNLTMDESTFEFLERHSIPAVHPQNGRKAIDLVELMLRLQRLGATLYPCGVHQREDFPGFLEELDVPVTELNVFELVGPTDTNLEKYQQAIADKHPDVIVFHSRRSVNRILAAYPDLDYRKLTVISADKGITNKLEKKEIAVDKEAKGSWESIAELI